MHSERLQTLAQYSPDMICTVDPENLMRYASPSCERILGWKPEELTGHGPEDFILPDDIPALKAAAAQTFQMDRGGIPVTVRMRRKDGCFSWMEITASVVRVPATGEVSEVVLIMRDVSERKTMEDQLTALALTDSLTGLANRRAFDDTLEREWNRTLREGLQISLLLLDLDHFKRFNDRYGHQVGDDCLRAVAAAIRQAVRASDIVARYGGEEIAVILPVTPMSGAVETAEKVRSAVEALELTHEGNPEGKGWVTATIGVATALARCGGTMKMPEGLLQAADNALYRAKHDGRNRVATALLVAPKNS